MAIPEDFPYVPDASAVSGTQLKFIVSKDTDQNLRESGANLEDRERDFARCTEILDWGVELLNEKLAKPKYAGLSPDKVLCKFRITLERNFNMPSAYQDWILARISERFRWRG